MISLKVRIRRVSNFRYILASNVFLYAVRTDTIIPTWLFDNSQPAEMAAITTDQVGEALDPTIRVFADGENLMEDARQVYSSVKRDDRKYTV